MLREACYVTCYVSTCYVSLKICGCMGTYICILCIVCKSFAYIHDASGFVKQALPLPLVTET